MSERDPSTKDPLHALFALPSRPYLFAPPLGFSPDSASRLAPPKQLPLESDSTAIDKLSKHKVSDRETDRYITINHSTRRMCASAR